MYWKILELLFAIIIFVSQGAVKGETTELSMPGFPTEHIRQVLDNEIYEMTICGWFKMKDGTDLADQSLVTFLKDEVEVWSLGFRDGNQLRLYQLQGEFSDRGRYQLNKSEIDMWKSWHRHCFVWVAGSALMWFSNMKTTSADVSKVAEIASSSDIIGYDSTLEVLRGLKESSILAGNVIGFNIWMKVLSLEEMNAPGIGCYINSPTVNSYTLYATSHSMRLTSKTCGKAVAEWRAVFHTSGDDDSGTNAQVYFTIFGIEGQTLEFMVDNPDVNVFERGQRDEFLLTDYDVGKLTHVTLRHDNTGDKPGWKLDYIEIENLNTREQYTISCNCWISMDTKTIYVSEEKWSISVWTADEDDAGTDAHVFMTLYGNKGESHEFTLDNNQDNFEQGVKDMFTIQTADLGDLSSIAVRRDDSGRKPGWKLHKVEIVNEKTGEIYTFTCGCWIPTYATTIQVTAEEWDVEVTTSKAAKAGTDANVYLIMYGDKGKSNTYDLDSPADDFEQGAKDTYKVESGRLGSLTKIEIYHDNSGRSAGWKLDQVQITNSKTKVVYTFRCDCWVSAGSPTEVRLTSKHK